MNKPHAQSWKFWCNQPLNILIGVFICSLIMQGTIWNYQSYLDDNIWTESATLVAEGTMPHPEDLVYGYPGTLLLIPAGLLIKVGIESLAATKIVMAVFISLGITCATFLCYLLRNNRWWLYAGLILSVNPFYIHSTLPTALTIILTCITALFTLYLFEKESENSYFSYAGLGALGGLLLMSRLDFGCLVFTSSVMFLWFFQKRRVILSVPIALFVSFIGTPYLWTNPLIYFFSVYEKIHSHSIKSGPSVSSTFFDFYNLSVFLGTISLIIGMVTLLRRPVCEPLPRPYLKGLISVTVLFTGGLVLSHHHPVWLFFPFTFIWELFLPLFIITISDKGFLRDSQSRLLLFSIILAHLAVFVIEVYFRPCLWNQI